MMQSRRAQLSRTRETSLDPVGVILSLLEELSADEFRRIVSLTGLSVDWQLSKVESFSHSTRKRAYIPKVQAALGLLAEFAHRGHISFIFICHAAGGASVVPRSATG